MPNISAAILPDRQGHDLLLCFRVGCVDSDIGTETAVDDSGHVALEDVQVGAADRGGVDLDNDVGGFGRGWIRDSIPGLLAGLTVRRMAGGPVRR